VITMTRGACRGALAVAALAVLLLDFTGCGSSATSGGIIYFRQKNFEKAVEQLSIAVKTNPRDYKAQYHLAISLAELQRWSEAATHFEEARVAAPAKKAEVDIQQEHYWAENHNQGVADLNTRDFMAAAAHFEAATQVWPEKAASYSLLGSSYSAMAISAKGDTLAQRENFEKASEYFGIAVRRTPRCRHLARAGPGAAPAQEDGGGGALLPERPRRHPAGLHRQAHGDPPAAGDQAFLAKRWDVAYERYLKAAEIRPDDARTQYQLGLCRFNDKKYAESADHFQKAADLSEGTEQEVFEDSLYNMGLAALNAEQGQRAIEAGERLVAANPAKADYYLLRARGKRSVAEALEKQGKRRKPTSSPTSPSRTSRRPTISPPAARPPCPASGSTRTWTRFRSGGSGSRSWATARRGARRR